MATKTDQLELSSGSGTDIGPGAGWQAFTKEMFRAGRGGRTAIHNQIGLVAGQLVLEEIELDNRPQIYSATIRFAAEANPPIRDTSNFMVGVGSAIHIESAKEAIAA